MKSLQKLGLISIPLTFLFAGIGMIWLLKVDNASGNFFNKLISNRTDWLGSHLVLLVSTVFLLPAAISIRAVLDKKIITFFATILVFVIAFTNILLAGQYAIDFLMPLLVDVGNDALKVHGLLYQNSLIDTLFYKLPNLVFLGLFLLTSMLLSSKKIPSRILVFLLINWLFVLIGNLIDPLFQRIAITFLAFSYVPFICLFWSKRESTM